MSDDYTALDRAVEAIDYAMEKGVHLRPHFYEEADGSYTVCDFDAPMLDKSLSENHVVAIGEALAESEDIILHLLNLGFYPGGH